MSNKWDYESRLETTTRADSGSYDQVVALSQGLINENFQKLYEAYPDLLSNLDYHGVLGKFKGKVLAPVILIPGADQHGANLNEVIMKMSFTSGSLKDSDDNPLIDDLNGWVFAVRTMVVPETLPDPSTIKDEKKRKAVEEKRKQIAERFDHPGDYGIDRLYMKLTTARWDNLDLDLSFAGFDENGKPLPYIDWASDEDNVDTKDLLEFWLKKWSGDNEKNCLNSLGLTFTPPDTPQVKATYAPNDVLHQVHQYKSEKNGYKDGQTGIGGAGDCNCLLFLEMVDGGGPKPQDPRLIWSGDFATLESYGHPAIQGTFLLNTDIFMKKFLLPNFTLLNRPTEIYHKPATFSSDGRLVWLHLETGGDPNYPDPNASVYQFQTVPDDDNQRLVKGYRWTKTSKTGPVDNGGAVWYRVWTEDDSKTEVTWEAGSDEVVLSGLSTSYENCRGAGTKSGLDNPDSWLYDKYTVTWKVRCKIIANAQEDASSSLHLEIQPPDNGASSYVNVERKVDHHNWQSGGYEDSIKDKLKTAGRLTYPGGAALDFQKPSMGRYGDLNAAVKMRPFKADGRIKVPDVNSKGGNSMSIASTSVASRAAVAHTGIAALAISGMPLVNPDFRGPIISSHKLTWAARSSKVPGIDGTRTLTIRGSNDTSKTVSLAASVLIFNVGEDEDKGCLFRGGSKFRYRSGGPFVPREVEEREKKEGEDDEPKPEDTVTLTWSPDMYTTTATINSPRDKSVELPGPNPAPEPSVVPWEIEIQSGGFWGEAMNVPPGAWFQLDITGTPTVYKGGPKLVSVREKTQDKAGKIIAEWEMEYRVVWYE
ncbi:hypothetical protein TrVFT333_007890 [Trichoderma virens FT-333]|nr:hypothetical protein TrVFT333_007890 [Trichoderma virens FT-333]